MKGKTVGILVGLGTLLLFVLIGTGLYLLGDSDQSALERLRDISVIYIVGLFALNVILLAAITGVFVWLAMQIKGKVIPMLEELTATAKRVRGTTEFVTEEAVKPLLTVATGYARLKAMGDTILGKRPKPKVDQKPRH